MGEFERTALNKEDTKVHTLHGAVTVGPAGFTLLEEAKRLCDTFPKQRKPSVALYLLAVRIKKDAERVRWKDLLAASRPEH